MRWVILILLFLGSLISTADGQVIGFAAEHLMKEFNINSSQWGLIGSSFFIVFIFTSFIGATWSDRVGAKTIMFIVLAGITLVQLGSFAIISFPMLILYRVLLGAFEGPFSPSAMSYVSKIFPEQLRGVAISVVFAGASIGGIISAPILVGSIEKYGWQWTLALLGVASLVVLVVWALVDRSSKSKQNVVEAVSAQKLKWADITPVLRNPACFLTLSLASATIWLAIWMTLWAPVYFTKVMNLQPMKMAYAIAGTGTAALVMLFLMSTISDRIFQKNQSYRKSRVLVAGISTIIGGISFAVIPSLGNSFLWVFVALCVAKGTTYLNVSMGVQIMVKLMPERSGLMNGLFTLIMNITSLVAPIIIGIIVQAAGKNFALGFNNTIYLIAGMFLLNAILYLLFVKPDKAKETTESKTVTA
ncbi:MFS transporter [Neobacillus sp. NRS-1170]|uniref:MFS transporter n=1 Tax=Neobacillus sp. NRS-1170 TaxID=3233898 RepID=UPI003D2B049D